MKTLKDQVAVITGGGNGLGRELALSLAGEGANIVTNDCRKESLEETGRLLAGRCPDLMLHHSDVADHDSIVDLFNKVKDRFRKVDILINNAGMSVGVNEIGEVKAEHWKRIFDVNFWGSLFMITTFLPLMKNRDSACIVNICSALGFIGVAKRAAYCASKFALRGLSESLQFELAPYRIKVITVFPGLMDTAISDHAIGWKNKGDLELSNFIMKNYYTTPLKKAASEIVMGIKKGKNQIDIGMDSKMIDLLCHIYPFSFRKFINDTILQRESMKISG